MSHLGSQQLLTSACRSPEALGEGKSKERWLSTFTADAMVQDPTGSPPNIGHNAMGRFYDTFISKNIIRFEILDDFVDVASQRVIRIVNINVNLSSDSNALMVQPAHLVYDIDPKSTLITRMDAIWGVWQARLMAKTPKQLLWSGYLFTLSLLPIFNIQGFAWGTKYLISLMIGVISGGQSLANRILDSASGGGINEFSSNFKNSNSSCILFEGRKMTPEEFQTSVWKSTKKFELLGKIKSGGWQTGVWYRRISQNGEEKRGALHFTVSWGLLFSTVESMYVVEK